jgi:imidazolonepropionase-like amidohydrolase
MKKPALISVLLFLFCALPAAETRGAPDGKPVALKAARVLTGTGTVYENGIVLIRGGKIEAVGVGLTLPTGCTVEDFGDAVIAPGLIDPDTALGAAGQNSEPVTALQPGASAEDAFNRFHEDFERALAAGITTVLITPSAENVVGGTAAAVKTAGECARSRVVRTGGPLVLTIGESAFKRDRYPTSRLGALDLLRTTLDGARAGKTAGGSLSPRLKAFAAGKLDGLFRAWHRYDIEAAITLQKEYGLRLALVNVADGWQMIDELKEAGLPLVMGAFSMQTPERMLVAPGKAARAGLKVAFTGNSPSWKAEYLRITAALAVRHGLDSAAGLAAITSHPAEITGIADRTGSLAPGKDADVVVFSGDPLDLTSRVLSVYVDGKLSYASSCPGSNSKSEVR